jgi:hypothetical protein
MIAVAIAAVAFSAVFQWWRYIYSHAWLMICLWSAIWLSGLCVSGDRKPD